jgi:hypothetical protein
MSKSSGTTSAYKREEGITGLETAIILMHSVIVASVLAFVVLSTGSSALSAVKRQCSPASKGAGNVMRGAVTGPDSACRWYRRHVCSTYRRRRHAVLIDPAADLNNSAINYIDSDERAGHHRCRVIAAAGGAATPTNDLLETGELVDHREPTGQVTTELIENVTATLASFRLTVARSDHLHHAA